MPAGDPGPRRDGPQGGHEPPGVTWGRLPLRRHVLPAHRLGDAGLVPRDGVLGRRRALRRPVQADHPRPATVTKTAKPTRAGRDRADVPSPVGRDSVGRVETSVGRVRSCRPRCGENSRLEWSELPTRRSDVALEDGRLGQAGQASRGRCGRAAHSTPRPPGGRRRRPTKQLLQGARSGRRDGRPPCSAAAGPWRAGGSPAGRPHRRVLAVPRPSARAPRQRVDEPVDDSDSRRLSALRGSWTGSPSAGSRGSPARARCRRHRPAPRGCSDSRQPSVPSSST